MEQNVCKILNETERKQRNKIIYYGTEDDRYQGQFYAPTYILFITKNREINDNCQVFKKLHWSV